MSVTGLLRRTKSLRLRRTKANSNDGDWPTIIKSRPDDDRFSNGQHIARHGVEASASSHCHSTPLSANVLSNEDFVVAEHQHSSSDCDSMFMSTAKPNYIAHKQDLEIGLAVSSPWETAQSDFSPGIASGPTWDNFNSPGWPFLAQRNVYCNTYEDDIAQPDQGKRKNASQLPEIESLSLSTTVQQTNSGTFPRRVSQEMAYTYRCPPEWEYSPPQTQEVKKTSRYGPYQHDFQRESDGPQRKKSWSRTLSRKKHKEEEIKVSVRRSQTWPLPSLPLHGSHTAPDYENTENTFLAITTDQFCPLQVEIPSVQLERYSVMFSNLIQPSDTSSLQNMGHVPPAENELPAKTGLKVRLHDPYTEDLRVNGAICRWPRNQMIDLRC